MDAKDRKKRLQLLLERQAIINKNAQINPCFEECIDALGENTIIYSQDKSQKIYKDFSSEYKITFYGRIQWSAYDYSEINAKDIKNNKVGIDSANEAYVLWSHGSDPVIRTTLKAAFNNFDLLSALSPDIWLYEPHKFVIEIFHDGIMRVLRKK
ncbi:hypothetical protein D3C81_1088690 [compost metagenome]